MARVLINIWIWALRLCAGIIRKLDRVVLVCTNIFITLLQKTVIATSHLIKATIWCSRLVLFEFVVEVVPWNIYSNFLVKFILLMWLPYKLVARAFFNVFGLDAQLKLRILSTWIATSSALTRISTTALSVLIVYLLLLLLVLFFILFHLLLLF